MSAYPYPRGDRTPGADQKHGGYGGGYRPVCETARRRLPPYLHRHAERLRTDASATVWIAIGSGAWRWAQERMRSHIVIVVPPGDDPIGYDWTACSGHDPILLYRAGPADGDQVRTLVEAVIRDGTDRVLDNQDGALYIVQGVDHAAA